MDLAGGRMEKSWCRGENHPLRGQEDIASREDRTPVTSLGLGVTSQVKRVGTRDHRKR